ncbi:Fatty acyl-CoA reductase [Sphingomonas antarctica]|uniref:SDR family NAD(P)-dependent oxidoreductase n=1 Tax=Sphingomonas antarctica TaxID=2040274 RepID=UPI0039E73012
MADKLALVTGASRGIGSATAEALAAEGWHVIITARNAKDLEAVEDRIHAAGGSATIAPLDLIDGESIGRLAGAVTERWGKLDLMVLNAATLGSLTPVPHIDPKEFARVLTLNIGAQAALIAAFDALLRKSDAPKVIGITSSVGATPRAYWGAYGASKAGFDTLLTAYAEENDVVGPIAVAVLDPGATRTKMRERAFPGEDPLSVKPPEAVARRIVELAQSDWKSPHRERVNDEF